MKGEALLIKKMKVVLMTTLRGICACSNACSNAFLFCVRFMRKCLLIMLNMSKVVTVLPSNF